MDFSSVQFIFVFLPLTLLVYYLMPRVCRNGVLAVFSLLFFAMARYRSAAVVLGAAFINWQGGLLLGYVAVYAPFLHKKAPCGANRRGQMKTGNQR